VIRRDLCSDLTSPFFHTKIIPLLFTSDRWTWIVPSTPVPDTQKGTVGCLDLTTRPSFGNEVRLALGPASWRRDSHGFKDAESSLLSQRVAEHRLLGVTNECPGSKPAVSLGDFVPSTYSTWVDNTRFGEHVFLLPFSRAWISLSARRLFASRRKLASRRWGEWHSISCSNFGHDDA
jgi:hypothetical protein